MAKRLQVPKELERLIEKREAEKDRRATAERRKETSTVSGGGGRRISRGRVDGSELRALGPQPGEGLGDGHEGDRNFRDRWRNSRDSSEGVKVKAGIEG